MEVQLNMQNFVSEASFWVPEFFTISAWIEHAPFAFWLVDVQRPRLLVELGAHTGFSYLAFAQAVKRIEIKSHCIAVDTWRGDEHAGFYGEEVFNQLHDYNYRRYGDFSELMRATFDEAVDSFEDGSIDLLHIDGRHFYDDVKHDFETWKPKLSERGVVLLHDTNVRVKDFGVYRLWNELTEKYPHFEFIQGHGLGVLGIGSALPDRLKELFAAAADEDVTREIREAYARLGSALEDRAVARRCDPDASSLENPELTRARAEIQRLEHEKRTVEVERANLQHEHGTLEHDYRQLEHERRALEHRHGRLESAHNLLQKELHELQSTYQETRDELSKQIRQIKTELQKKRQEVSGAIANREDLHKKLSQATADSSRLKFELSRQATELSEVRGSFSWRLTKPLRWAAKNARSAKRHVILPFRVLWWLVTFQLQSRMRLRAEKRFLLESGLFDEPFYLKQNEHVAQAGIDPVEHYLRWGAASGCDPNPIFDSRWYITHNADVASQDRNPLIDYLRGGWEQGRNPGPLFDIAFYVEQNADIAKAGLEPLGHYLRLGGFEARNPHALFESDWYLTKNPDVAAAGHNPLAHYVKDGWKERRDPHPLFDTAFYLERNPDVSQAGENPLKHFLASGGLEKRDPHPLFNSAFYLGQNPDVSILGVNPLLHYLRHGRSEGRNPNAFFDTEFYLEQNPDIARAGTDALQHYLQSGGFEARNPHPLFHSQWYLEQNPDAAQTGVNPLVHYLSHGHSEGRDPHPLFDSSFYLAQNPDVAEAGMNAVDHYLHSGGFEGRDPHPLFDSGWYLRRYPNVAEARVNPLLHYLRTGWKAGYSPCALFDGAFYLEQYPDVLAGNASALEHYILSGAAEGRDPSRSFDTDWYSAHHRDVAASHLNPLVHYARNGLREGRRAKPIASETSSEAIVQNGRRRVVFVSGEEQTPGHRYRIVNIATSLAPHFFETLVINSSELPDRLKEVATADLVWIWRAPWSEDVAALIDAARRQGAKIVFDVDDLMFRPELALVKVIDGIRSMDLTETDVQKFYVRVQATLGNCDHCTVPTVTLAREVKDFWKTTSVIPNGFDRTTFEAARAAWRARKSDAGDGLIRIGYATGSRTHQRDLAVAVGALAAILAENPSARLVLFRRTLIPEEFPELQRLESQVEWRDLVSVDDLPLEYARFDINLAPLEVGNRFCEAKSELKFFEAALVGVPTIASPTRPFAEAIQHGETGFLANSNDDWYECLNRLVKDRELRERIASSAYRQILWLYGPERRSMLVTRLVNRLLAPAPVGSDLFLAEMQSEGPALLPEIPVPAYDVLYQSERRGTSRVSVIIPVFNYAHYLEGALESVRQQTMRDIDVIVVDDQSTDASIAVASDWLKLHGCDFNMVALLQNRQNAKLGASRNAGVSFSDTEVFFPLDPDNLFLPPCVEKCLALLDETGAAYVYPTIEVFGDRTEEIGLLSYDPAYFQCGNYIDAMAIVRKAAWIAVGGYGALDPPGYEDYDFWCKLAEKGLFGARLNEVVARYRAHNTSMLQTVTDLPENKKQVLRDMSSRHPWLQLPCAETTDSIQRELASQDSVMEASVGSHRG